MKLFPTLLFALLALAFPTLHASAEVPGDHPGYLHALTDLRTARFLVGRDNPGPRDQLVIDEIDKAIGEIKTASIDDGKNLNDHPPIDTGLDYRGRFHRALELLNKSHHDINKDEDNVFAQGLQHRALLHIDQARHTLHEIINSW